MERTILPLAQPPRELAEALTCARLAQTSVSPQAREHFASLARTWIRLADDLERTQAFLDAMVERGRAEETNTLGATPGLAPPSPSVVSRKGPG